jgi:hypothetical protein
MIRRLFFGLAIAAAIAFGSAAQAQQISQTGSNGTGLSLSSTQVPNNTTAIVVDANPGLLYHIEAFNNSAVIAYIKLYDAASTVTCGTGESGGTNPVWRGMIPSNSTNGAGYISVDANGLAFVNSIVMCITLDFADSGTTAPAASAYIVNIGYK